MWPIPDELVLQGRSIRARDQLGRAAGGATQRLGQAATFYGQFTPVSQFDMGLIRFWSLAPPS